MKKIIFGLGLVALQLVSCHKGTNPPMQLVRLDSAFSYRVDSCCVDIPNVFTPNGDGINDELYVHALYLAELHLRIYNSNNQLVFSIDAGNQYITQHWDGKQNTPNGRVVIKGKYKYYLNALSLSGRVISASRYITIIEMPPDCITHNPPPLFGDMMDPRDCGIIYQTMETVCYVD